MRRPPPPAAPPTDKIAAGSAAAEKKQPASETAAAPPKKRLTPVEVRKSIHGFWRMTYHFDHLLPWEEVIEIVDAEMAPETRHYDREKGRHFYFWKLGRRLAALKIFRLTMCAEKSNGVLAPPLTVARVEHKNSVETSSLIVNHSAIRFACSALDSSAEGTTDAAGVYAIAIDVGNEAPVLRGRVEWHADSTVGVVSGNGHPSNQYFTSYPTIVPLGLSGIVEMERIPPEKLLETVKALAPAQPAK